MKKILLLCLLFLIVDRLSAQKSRSLSILLTNSQPANPFSKGIGLVKDGFHPGVEVGRSTTISQKKKHEYLFEFRAGYFYHRFVQHAIPVYVNLGYSYKVNKRFSVNAKLGAGYLHSIPATTRLTADENGTYHKVKGFGRPQAMANFELGMAYIISQSSHAPFTILLGVQQRLQMKFIRSYVPILPYNTIFFGVQHSISRNK
jgi:hypothetical protein